MTDSQPLSELQLDVDEMTLDYLTHMAILAVFDEIVSHREVVDHPRSSATEPLKLVKSFLRLFKAKYPHQDASANVLFRLHLLTFASLFARRFSHSPLTPSPSHLQLLVSQNHVRASRLVSQRGLNEYLIGLNNPIEAPANARLLTYLTSGNENEHLTLNVYLALFKDRNNVELRERLAINGQEINSAQQASEGPGSVALSLLELFPSFLAVCAGQDLPHETWSLPSHWLQLVKEYRIRAVIEEARIFANAKLPVLRKALAWSPSMLRTTYADASADEIAIREMFSTFSEEENLYWTRSEAELVKLLATLPSSHAPNIAAMDHLDELAARFPRHAFEEKLLDALVYMASLPEKPILVQLEEGKLDGMSEEETAELMARCGL